MPADAPADELFAAAPRRPRQHARDGRTGLALMALVAIIGAGAAFGLALRTSAFYPVRVVSNSMSPTIRAGDWVVVSPLPDSERASIGRGEIILYRYPAGSDGRAVKRVVALPGDVVAKVVAGAAGVAEVPGAGAGAAGERVPPGHFFIVGDNTGSSLDSRTLGPLAATEVVGRVRFTLPLRW